MIDLDAELWFGDDGEPTVHLGGGWAWFDLDQPNRGVFRDVDLSGNVLLDHAQPVFGLGFNHHSERLPDGSYLSLTGSENVLGEDQWYGVGIEQWDPRTGWWSWSSQHLVDQGVLGVPEDGVKTPYHSNSVSFVSDEAGEGAWVSLYAARRLADRPGDRGPDPCVRAGRGPRAGRRRRERAAGRVDLGRPIRTGPATGGC